MTPARKPVSSSKSKRPAKKKAAADVRTNPPVGTRGKSVRPLKGQPGMGQKYDYGFRPPPERNPWQDEGRPEASG
jgi:hypothetical protein